MATPATASPWTPGLGFSSIPVDETCAALATPISPAPQAFRYESITVSYTPGVLVRFDIEGDLTFVQGWLHDMDDTCTRPGAQGGGAEIYAEFDVP